MIVIVLLKSIGIEILLLFTTVQWQIFLVFLMLFQIVKWVIPDTTVCFEELAGHDVITCQL